jgi:hypothetical protein
MPLSLEKNMKRVFVAARGLDDPQSRLESAHQGID